MISRKLIAALCCTLLLLSLGCMPGQGNRIVIGSKNFTEQLVLGELLAQHIEHTTHLPVERRFYLAGTYICQQALLAGRIDLYVEYTGTALTAILKEKPSGEDAAVFRRVEEEYARRFNLVVMPPLGFNNTFAIVVRGSDARQLRLRTISDLARYAPQWRAGFGYEFMERPDGYAGLAKTYNLHFKEAPRIMDLGLLYRALQEKQVDVVAASATDGLIAALDMAVLEDDRHYFPPYDAVPVVRRDTVTRHPEIQHALDELAGRITADDMRRLNYALDGEHRDVGDVVAEFLKRKKLE
jgi:osmoprotectant transport system substrate-binding protein